MSNNDIYQAKDLAKAQLALQLSSESAKKHTTEIDDETLAAFFDNTLENEKREHVLKQITIDPALYARWIGLVDSIHSLETNNQQTAEIIPITQRLNKKSSSPQQSSKKGWDFSVFGSGLATAAVIAIAVILVPTQQHITNNMSDDLSDFYKQYGVDISGQSARAPAPSVDFSESRSLVSPETQAEYVKIIQTGFLVGAHKINNDEFTKWGYPITNFNIIKPDEINQHTKVQYNLLFELGKLSTLTAIPCQLQSKGIDVSKFHSLSQTLLAKLATELPNKFATEYSKFTKSIDNTQAICGLTNSIKALMTQQ